MANTFSKIPAESDSAKPSNEHFAEDLRGFGPLGILAILIILLSGNVFIGNIIFPIGAILVIVWVWLSHTPWREIGFVRPRSWIVTILSGLVLGIVFKIFMKAVIMPLLGADPINQAYHHLAGNKSMLPAAIWAMFVAGFAEETVFRGYMFERLGKIFGNNMWAMTLIVLITSILFSLGHIHDQGFSGAEQAFITGLVFGTTFAITGRIWIVMIIHSVYDLTALTIIYLNIESDVAHLIFK